MKMDHVRLYVLMCVKLVMCVQAQVTFNPDPEEDVQLQLAVLTPPVYITTIQCYLSSPKFTVQYVNENEAVYDLSYYGNDDFTGESVNAITCENNKRKYRRVLNHLSFIADPVLVGGTFRLKATLDNNEENSTMSRRTYTFPAPFNLTGSSVSAVLGSPFTWKCHVTSDYPVIEWFRGSTNLGQIGILSGACVTFGQNDSYIYTCQESALTYTLTVPGSSLTEELQETTWRCKDVIDEVKGSAFRKLDIVVPVTTITIYPGGGSTISVDEYQTINYTCTTNDANPAPTMLWYIGSSDVTSQAAGSNRTTLTLNVTRAEHQMAVKCVTWNSGNTANLSDSTTLYVRYPPSTPVISISSQFPWKENESKSLTLDTTPGNPQATTYIWKEGGSMLSTTSHTYSINPLQPIDNGRQLQCQVNNNFTLQQNSVLTSAVTTLQVEYPPTNSEALQITGYTSGQVMYENDTAMIDISCTQPGGNPVANMTFTCGSQIGTNGDTATEAIRRLILKNDRTLNGQNCTCVSTHINGYRRSQIVSFLVYYPPSTPTVRKSSLFPWKAPGNYSLSCMAVQGNPAETAYIWKEGGSVLPTTSQTYDFSPLNWADNGRRLQCQVNNNFTLHENMVLSSNVTALPVEYDPVVTLEQNLAEVIEGQTAVLRCSATGNPAPTVTWYRDSTSVTANTISSSNYSIVNVSRTASGNYTCEGKSSSTGSNVLQPDQKTVHLWVFYPPTVSLYLQNSTENTENYKIRCTAAGDPNNATILALQQRIGSTFIRNITSFTELSPGNITWTIPRVSYQDMGTYTCLASNGISDRNNQKIQSDMAYFSLIGTEKSRPSVKLAVHGGACPVVYAANICHDASAKFGKSEYTMRSDVSKTAAISIPFYRNPPATQSDLMLINNTGTSNETLVSSAIVFLSLAYTDAKQTFHGVDVTLKGQSANMIIPTFHDYYEGKYTLKIRSSHADSAKVRFVLQLSGPPDNPSDFQLLTRKVTSVVLAWNKGFDGGRQQTFVVLYREKTTAVYDVKQIVDTRVNVTITDEIKHLKSDTSYEFILYSFNEKGNSTGHKTLEERTLKAPVTSTPDSLNSGLVGGALGGGAAVVVAVIVIIVVMRRRQERDNETHLYQNQDRSFYTDLHFDRPTTNDEEERTAYTMLQLGQQHTYSNMDNVQGAEGGQ